jgi:hypothetical protein
MPGATPHIIDAAGCTQKRHRLAVVVLGENPFRQDAGCDGGALFAREEGRAGWAGPDTHPERRDACQGDAGLGKRHGDGQGAQHQHHADAHAAGTLLLFGQARNTVSCIMVHGGLFYGW